MSAPQLKINKAVPAFTKVAVKEERVTIPEVPGTASIERSLSIALLAAALGGITNGTVSKALYYAVSREFDDLLTEAIKIVRDSFGRRSGEVRHTLNSIDLYSVEPALKAFKEKCDARAKNLGL